MLAHQRQQKILEILQRKGGVRVSELSRYLSVSEMTIRRDLDCLERRACLVRIHGGAIPLDILTEPAFSEKADLLASEKQRIAQAAAHLVGDGIIGLSAGTTTSALAACLPRDNCRLTVVTNALNIAWTLAGTKINIMMMGGSLRSSSYALVGPALQQVDDISLDILFLGANGISLQGGITTPNPAEAETNAKLLARARKVIVVADHSKLGRTARGHIADLAQVNMLITCREASKGFIREAENTGLEVKLV